MGLRSEWNLLKAAVMCYTRLPAGEVHFDAETAHEAARYMPLVGALIGGCGAAVYALAFFSYGYLRLSRPCWRSPR